MCCDRRVPILQSNPLCFIGLNSTIGVVSPVMGGIRSDGCTPNRYFPSKSADVRASPTLTRYFYLLHRA